MKILSGEKLNELGGYLRTISMALGSCDLGSLALAVWDDLNGLPEVESPLTPEQLGRLAELKAAADAACAAFLEQEGYRLRKDLVQKNKLCCASARHSTDDKGKEFYGAVIEGAVSDFHRFHFLIAEELRKKEWGDVEVSTEW